MAKLKEKPKRGCIARLLFWVSAASSLLLAAALVSMLLPQDLSDIDGYAEGIQTQKVRNLTQVLHESVERGHELTLSEGEINRWLSQTLRVRQAGLLAGQVKLSRMGIRLEPGRAEIVIERRMFGLSHTLSMYLQVLVESDGNTTSKEVLLHGGPMLGWLPLFKRGGRFGSLTVPQGYLYLVKPTFFQLGDVYKEEVNLMFRKMHEIRIEQDRVVFKPRAAAAAIPAP